MQGWHEDRFQPSTDIPYEIRYAKHCQNEVMGPLAVLHACKQAPLPATPEAMLLTALSIPQQRILYHNSTAYVYISNIADEHSQSSGLHEMSA